MEQEDTRMTEREKLIEILGGMSGIAWSPSVRGIIADHLLANGVLPVVHCKDCKLGTTPYGDERDGWTECTNLCGRPLMPDEGFCSYGERRE